MRKIKSSKELSTGVKNWKKGMEFKIKGKEKGRVVNKTEKKEARKMGKGREKEGGKSKKKTSKRNRPARQARGRHIPVIPAFESLRQDYYELRATK